MPAGTFHLFAYGSLRANGARPPVPLRGAEPVANATVEGMLFDAGDYPALVLAGRGAVHGEIWRCPAELLPELDRYEGVGDGLYRRAGVRIGDLACWTYVAGPRLARDLTPDRRIESGYWPGRSDHTP